MTKEQFKNNLGDANRLHCIKKHGELMEALNLIDEQADTSSSLNWEELEERRKAYDLLADFIYKTLKI